MIDLNLLERFVRDYPFQPATALWRAVEVGFLCGEPLPDGLGLDLGCGDGKLTRIILDLVGPRDLVGIDIDPVEIELAATTGIYRRLHAVSSSRIPEGDNTFDFVISNSVLEHIADIDGTLAETSRVLKPGGRFVATVPSDGFHACLRGPRLLHSRRAQYLSKVDLRCAHLRYWDEVRWRTELKLHGMALSAARPYLNRSEVRRWETVSNLTAGVLFALFGGRKHPIEIQRKLGLRRSGQRLPGWLAAPLSRLLALGLVRDDAPGVPCGCLLIEAVKLPAAR